MTRLLAGIISMALIFVSGCGPVQTTTLQDQHLEIYAKIFSEEKPDDVEIAHSFFVSYSPRFGVVTTADFEIELIAPKQWINEKCKNFYLIKAESPRIIDNMSARKEQANEWYAPKDISDYDLYYLYATSIPYIHMLVDKELVAEDRYRIYFSKH